MIDTETGLETRYYIALSGGMRLSAKLGPDSPEKFVSQDPREPIDLGNEYGLAYPVSAGIYEEWTADEDWPVKMEENRQCDAALVWGDKRPDMPCTRRQHDDDEAHFNDQHEVSWFDPPEVCS